MASLSISQVGELLGLVLEDDGRTLQRVSNYEEARPDSIVFAREAAALELALQSPAGLILAPLDGDASNDARVLRVADPKYAFALCGRALGSGKGTGIHPSAVIESGAVVGEGSSVGAGAVLEAGVTIGEQCVLGHGVIVHGGTRLGDRVVVQAGTVLGAMGFGYVRGTDGRYVGFPQIGRLWIGDDVEIGANCTIDRGALGETRIGRGTKIDNLVHVAHNCRIGEDVIIAAQTGIAGSTVVEDGAILGGQVGLAEHVTIGAGVVLGAQCGVPTGKKIRGAGQVFWGTPARPIQEYLKDLARLKRR